MQRRQRESARGAHDAERKRGEREWELMKKKQPLIFTINEERQLAGRSLATATRSLLYLPSFLFAEGSAERERGRGE